jgi:hypothetical protein
MLKDATKAAAIEWDSTQSGSHDDRSSRRQMLEVLGDM